MKVSTAALLALISANDAFVLQQRTSFIPSTKKTSATPQNSNNRMVMFATGSGGKGGLEQIMEEFKSKPAVTATRKIPAPVRKLAKVATIPVAAVGGFLMTPSDRLLVGAVGGAITGIAGSVGKSAMDSVSEVAAKPALAQLLLDRELEDPQLPELVQEIRTSYGVSEDDFTDVCVDVYKRYAVAMCSSDPIAKTNEISELAQLKNVLALDNLSIGEAHAAAAADVFRLKCMWTPEAELADPDHPDRMAVDKFLFLTERAFRSADETEEAFQYEMSRVGKAFGIDLKEIGNRVSAKAKPFYERALSSTRSKLESGAVSSDMLKKARNTLGINEWQTRDMHVETYSDEVRSLLGVDREDYDASKCKFPDGALERLAKLQQVLELSDEDARYEIEAEVTPVFQAGAVTAIEAALEDASVADVKWESIVSRQKELGISDDTFTSIVDSAAIQTIGNVLEEAVNFAKVNNEIKTFETLEKVLIKKHTVVDLMSSKTGVEKASVEEKYFDVDSNRSATGFVPYMERPKLYSIFFSQSLKQSKGGKTLSEEQEAKLAELRPFLGISDDTHLQTVKNICGPVVEMNIMEGAKDIIGPEYDEDLAKSIKGEIEKLINNLKVPDELVQEYGRQAYRDQVNVVATNSPAGIPSKEYAKKLEVLRGIVGLSEEDAMPMHNKVFTPAYKKSVLEAMGATGVIREEYKVPLNQLRERLLVSEEDAEGAFLEAIADKMKPMVENLSNEMERTLLTTDQLSQKRGVDMGEDLFQHGKGANGKLGIASGGDLMGDCMNIIDFYKENGIGKKQVGVKSVEKKVVASNGEEKTETVEEPEYEYSYPVTALSTGGINQENAETVFRQFLVSSFTEQGPQAARYEENSELFGNILGFDKEKQEEIGANIGGLIYDNYVTQTMATKPALDQQDMMFLANIQGKLNLSSEKSEELLMASQKKILLDEINNLTADMGSLTSEKIKAFRERSNMMGMDLKEDLGLSTERLKGLFTVEVLQGIDTNAITPDTIEILTEVQESLSLTAEECEAALEKLIVQCASGTLQKIETEFRRGRDQKVADEIEKLINYAAFVEGDIDLDVSEEVGNRIVNVYDSVHAGEEETEKSKAARDLLFDTLDLSR